MRVVWADYISVGIYERQEYTDGCWVSVRNSY